MFERKVLSFERDIEETNEKMESSPVWTKASLKSHLSFCWFLKGRRTWGQWVERYGQGTRNAKWSFAHSYGSAVGTPYRSLQGHAAGERGTDLDLRTEVMYNVVLPWKREKTHTPPEHSVFPACERWRCSWVSVAQTDTYFRVGFKREAWCMMYLLWLMSILLCRCQRSLPGRRSCTRLYLIQDTSFWAQRNANRCWS